jgi:predicted CoA-binding protein
MSQPSVAIVGASSDRTKYGNKAVRAHQQQGFDVYPVNTKGGEIEGLTVYRSLSEIPLPRLTRVSMYVPPMIGLGLLDEIEAKGCDELWLNPGSESPALVEQAEARGLNVVVACSIVDLGRSPAEFEQ